MPVRGERGQPTLRVTTLLWAGLYVFVLCTGLYAVCDLDSQR